MRVLHIFSNPHLTNGASIFEYRVSEKLKYKDIFFDYLVTENPTEDEMKRYDNQGSKIYKLDLDNKHGLLVRELKANYKYYKFFKQHDYQIVYVDTENSLRAIHLLMARFAGVKIRVVHSHNNGLQTNSNISKYISLFIKNFFNYSATDFFACSDEAAKWLFPKNIFERKQYRIINNGIDTEAFLFNNHSRKIIRNKFRIKDTDLVLGSVARFVEQKNHSFMLDIIYELKKSHSRNVKLLLVGEGRLEKQIKKQAEKLGVFGNVIFAGTTSNVSEMLSAMDIFLMPSLFEGFGIAALEAQANGLPCILSDKLTKDLNMSDNIQYLPIDSVDDWVNQIIRLKKIDRIDGNQAVEKIENRGYSLAKTVEFLEVFYKGKIMGEKL